MSEADSENAQAANLDAVRKFDQKMKMTQNLQTTIRNNKIILSGENGDQLLNFFKETNDLVNLAVNE